MKTRKFGTLSLNVLKLRTVKWGCLRTKNSTNSRIQQVVNSGSGTRKSRSKQLYKRPSICNLKTENFRTKIFLLLATLEFGTLKLNHVQNSRIAEISMPASCYLRKIIIASFTIFWPDSYDIELHHPGKLFCNSTRCNLTTVRPALYRKGNRSMNVEQMVASRFQRVFHVRHSCFTWQLIKSFISWI